MINISEEKIEDYTGLTCTNLMIKLKIKLKKLRNGNRILFFSTREQYDNIRKPFSKKYDFEVSKVDHNKYLISIEKD
ncbi:MAG: hypothetical protein ACOC44_03880 [Promethearchaeia archaeon]